MGNLFGDDDYEEAHEMEEEIASVLDANFSEPEEFTPRSNPDLIGHEEIEGYLLKEYLDGRMPHAIILAGAKGIGKATLAYRLAKFLFAQNNSNNSPETLAVSSNNPAFRRVVSLGHADLLVVEREYDEKRERFKAEIPVDAARKVAPFLQKTSAEGGWKVVIIDGADSLNQNGQNAILKILEEAPKKSLLILTANQPGLFLPTIRSRCRVLSMNSLNREIMLSLLNKTIPSLSLEDKNILMEMGEGSIGTAIEFYRNDGIKLYKEISSMLSNLPKLDMVKLHELAEKLGKSSAETSYYMAINIILKFCENKIRAKSRNGLSESYQETSYFLNSWDKISALAKNIDKFNLDKRQGIMGAFLTLHDPEYKGIVI